MEELNEYEVEVNGVTITQQLTAEDAERIGAKQAGNPSNKSGRPSRNADGLHDSDR